MPRRQKERMKERERNHLCNLILIQGWILNEHFVVTPRPRKIYQQMGCCVDLITERLTEETLIAAYSPLHKA